MFGRKQNAAVHVNAGLPWPRESVHVRARGCKPSHSPCKPGREEDLLPSAPFEWQANPLKLTRLSSRLPEADLTLVLLRARARMTVCTLSDDVPVWRNFLPEMNQFRKHVFIRCYSSDERFQFLIFFLTLLVYIIANRAASSL